AEVRRRPAFRAGRSTDSHRVTDRPRRPRSAPRRVPARGDGECLMVAPDPAHDRGPLLLSIAVTAVLGAIAIAWGIVGGSQMILLDGVYSIVGIALSLGLIGASAISATPPTRRYPFGRAGAVPIAISVQALILGATL